MKDIRINKYDQGTNVSTSIDDGEILLAGVVTKRRGVTDGTF